MGRFLWFCLTNKLVVFLFVVFVVGWGIMVAPFDWDTDMLPRRPVPVDAIPDIGENQQIVFTEWMGRSPQDVEDQIGYPLTVSLLGVPGVKTIRSYSMFGFSTVYIIFKENIDFYWSRSRVLEKLNSIETVEGCGGWIRHINYNNIIMARLMTNAVTKARVTIIARLLPALPDKQPAVSIDSIDP